MHSNDTYILDDVRTPIGSLGGALSSIRTDDLPAHVLREIMERNPSIPISAIDDVIMGCANQAGEDNRNIARMALLLAGLPISVPGETVNRLCASGMSAIIQGHRAIQCGDADIVIAGGVEHMTRGPLVMSKSSKAFGSDVKLEDSTFGWRFVNPKMVEMYGVDPMGVTAENLADMYHISREDQDLFAFHSQQKAAKAWESDAFATEITPVKIPQRKGDALLFAKDEFMKPATTLEGLSSLRAAFKKDGSVTAGNASGLNDGAAAALIASGKAAETFGVTPLARIVSSGVIGVEPHIMGIGPVPASEIALKRAGLTMDDIDIIELNEAFAAQSIACIRQFGLKDDDPRINIHGGAIALGHPLGMSGTRITVAAARNLHKVNGRYALATMCIGVGQGYAVVLERV